MNGKPDLMVCQVTLRVQDHTFLRHDSFLDCTQVFDSINYEEIVAQLVADYSRIKGELSAAARALAQEAVRKAKTVPDSQKRRILASL
jgi:hypothetical protein